MKIILVVVNLFRLCTVNYFETQFFPRSFTTLRQYFSGNAWAVAVVVMTYTASFLEAEFSELLSAICMGITKITRSETFFPVQNYYNLNITKKEGTIYFWNDFYICSFKVLLVSYIFLSHTEPETNQIFRP
jgi:hypothetical protein